MFDTHSFEEVWKTLYGDSVGSRGVRAFVRLLEKRTGAKLLFDRSSLPFDAPELLDLFERAEKMKRAGIVKDWARSSQIPDEPRIHIWRASLATTRKNITGGMSVRSERDALTATLAEALERYLWLEDTGYFRSARTATAKAMPSANVVLPERFAGFSATQRAADERLTLREDAPYLWVRGRSLVSGSNIWIPAQIISGKYGGEMFRTKQEPMILVPLTTGLATGPTREFALLNGALEIIERDAFMIMWLNQLSPPRVDLDALRKHSPELGSLLDMCTRYRLRAEAIRMPTDAPAYAICGIIRDESDVGPPFTCGLRSHRNLARAIEGALLEALRMRRNLRTAKPLQKEKHELNLMERTVYWADRSRAGLLDFLSEGAVGNEREAWEGDSESEHLDRVRSWCAEKGYEFAHVSLGDSKKNVTPWFVEMVVIPELIPIHQNERYPYAGGARITEIPKQFGYTPRTEPFLDEPHPLA